ncbi:beta-glucosidase [Bacteroides reticulotermitis JCM 10512]|uniref:Beta-glucosidase n=3 Tax=Bacteroides reticulotermitis TaxID=1133319 RepID=W4URL9_9BACE|nr:beta-glucosidase [Bacteroides reticulotermitis JCM 10512]
MYERQGEEVVPSPKFKQLIAERPIGMLWATYRADPWTKKTLANGLNPALAAKAGNALQRYMLEHTRLGIPIFLAEEAPHGHMAIGTTVFPTGIGMAASWSPELLKEAGEAIGKEMRLQGGHISYGPVLDLARDPRWSRVEETFGEDPVLTGVLGAAMVEGLGGGDLSQAYSTVATLKHFLAYAVPEGGQNGNQAMVGMRELHENFLPPFRKAIEAGALSVMTSYNSIDGIPCTANSYLLDQLLRNEWKFRGFTVSDLYSIEGIHENHAVASSLEDASLQAVTAGVDVDLGGDAYTHLIRAIREDRLQEAVVDTAVCRVLRMKFAMGLFEHPYTVPEVAAKEVRSREHIALARRLAQASITLLKNEGGLLPLSKSPTQRIAVIGPNADNCYNLLGDYTAPQAAGNVKTVWDGVRSKLPASQVEYVKGCAIRDTTAMEIEKAVAAARRSDVVIAVVGGSSARDFKTQYKETGAAIADKGILSDMESGEGFDRATLSLLGGQQTLLEAVKATGKPLVVVYVEGRPLDKNWAAEQADALLTAYYPGQEGGNAIADVLFGDYNPAGRLPVSVPRSVGQLPVYYNKKAPPCHDYVEMSATPLYAFGYGLSYTEFAYSELRIEKQNAHTFTVSFCVQNTGT